MAHLIIISYSRQQTNLLSIMKIIDNGHFLKRIDGENCA
jgi:hypothetical protein